MLQFLFINCSRFYKDIVITVARFVKWENGANWQTRFWAFDALLNRDEQLTDTKMHWIKCRFGVFLRRRLVVFSFSFQVFLICAFVFMRRINKTNDRMNECMNDYRDRQRSIIISITSLQNKRSYILLIANFRTSLTLTCPLKPVSHRPSHNLLHD